MDTPKIVQACIVNCQNKPFTIKIGDITHTFCCEKGYNEFNSIFK